MQTKITPRNVEFAVELLKSLANTHRLRIVYALLDGERSVGELERTLGIRQPSLSQQLGELREAGIVGARRAAKQVYYRLANEQTAALIAALQTILQTNFTAGQSISQLGRTSPNPTSMAAQFAKVVPFKPQ